MPFALEQLVKILKLEQETNYKNTAVIGGLESYQPNWARDAHQQAKNTTHHALVDELSNAMRHYATLETKEERYDLVRYMLGRITRRVKARAEFLVEIVDEPGGSSAEKVTVSPVTTTTRQEPSIESPEEADDDTEDAASWENDEDDDANDESDIIDDLLAFSEIASTEAPALHHPKPRRKSRQATDLAEQIQHLSQLSDPVDTLRGVGKKRAEKLANLGIVTVGDLIFHFPRRYDDYTRMTTIHRMPHEGLVAVAGTITEVVERTARDRRRFIVFTVDDGTGQLRVTFFNQPYLKQQLKPGSLVVFYGKVDLYLGRPTLTNPDWEVLEQRNLQKGWIVPIYNLTEGVSAKMMRGLMKQVVDEWSNQIPDYMPESVLDRTEMVDLGWALRQIHFPDNWDYLYYAQERVAFDELMLLQLGILTKRREWQSVPAIPLPVDDEWLNTFASTLPYELTNAQQRAVQAIRDDVVHDIPMNRLLQGDVGSGKTVVAAMALSMALANGQQAALMAPTSILAEQHFSGISKLLAQLPGGDQFQIRLLTGGTPGAERQEIYEGLANGSIHVVIGTHALIQENVEFATLGLAVIDEQHRFGVEERGTLRGKGTNPHVLVMTATPIPRTLALTMYADLDLTVLDEMPPGRSPVHTRLLFPNERERAYSFIRSQVDSGRQAFIIYPLVEASESIDALSAVEGYEELAQTTFQQYRVGLIHGRLKPTEKDAIMADFSAGELDILIATSVIEVGIDVPNASVILIEGANRFGLAQLHQLRGRVGRGQHQSYCLLQSDSDDPEAIQRLQAVEETADGFTLAELDWQLRGPGDLLGTRQAGFSAVRMDSMMNTQLVELAQQESQAIYAEDPYLEQQEHALLAKHIHLLEERRTDFS
jgi:ATP-dependent DNA helicase RecG